ncbi:tripartite tricarboxylate transporter substrate binding protein [Pigmentiphaga sp. H8]|uniref:Bug family tripartite tricarboxylate transporter substrate binding protein n=1 Tax=unclassified Pigmentiphaga TaxID=2626614 RepID=UPI000F5B64D5|nr:tripartite tricarboxylate transporter substrate binding protein [Pigmentiphaga sp. H8]AZG11447.1 tripartite tricarboxylate transporter substrate binding protein [Pigmentiphaga sp. H8]
MTRRRFIRELATLAGATATLPGARALAQEAWPAKPIRLVHGFTAGGAVDIQARLLAQQLTEHLGQTAYVEGKPGAGGTLGANLVAKAAPDGYTLFFMASGHSAAPGLYKSLPFDPAGDFTLASMVTRSPFVILAGPAAKSASVRDLVAEARARPRGVDFGTGGIGTGMHLAAVLFQSRLGVQMTHVPYKGGNAPMMALMGGEVPYIFTSLAGNAVSQIQAGAVRALAVTSIDRYPGLPEVPTVAETVLPGFDVSAWYALAGPRGLPPAVVRRLNETVAQALSDAGMLAALKKQAASPWPTTAAQAQSFVAEDIQRWTQVIRSENIAPET